MLLLTHSDIAVLLTESCFPNFSHADDTSIIDFLSFRFDSFSKSTANVDLWISFKDLVLTCVDCFVPSIIKKIKHGNPWISLTSLQMRRRLKQLKKKKQTVNRPGCLLKKYFHSDSSVKKTNSNR